MSDKTRYRILWPRPSNPKHGKVSHWIFAADNKHKPIFYGHSAVVFYKNGRKGEIMQLHKEF